MLRDAAINPLPDGSSNRILLADMLKLPGFKSGSKSPWWWIPEDDPPVTGVDGIPLSLPKQSSLFVKEKKKRLGKKITRDLVRIVNNRWRICLETFAFVKGGKCPEKIPKKHLDEESWEHTCSYPVRYGCLHPRYTYGDVGGDPEEKFITQLFFSDKSVVSLPKRSKPIKLKCSSN